MVHKIPKTVTIYFAWLAIAVLVYPIALAIPILTHMLWNHIPITVGNIVPYTYFYGYGDRTVLYLSLYCALVGVVQQLFLRYFLAIRIQYWAIGTFLGGFIAMLILRTEQTPFGNSANLAPWFFGFSAVQATLLFRYTSWSWLWVVAHVSIAGMFPLSTNNSLFDLISQWTIKTGIGGIVTMVVLQIVITKARENSSPKKRKNAET